MPRVLILCLITAAAVAQGRPDVQPRPAFAEPGIAPDGSEIAFVSGGDIWTVPAAGGDARLIVSSAANDTRPLFSPDKTRLAFVSTRTGGGDIYVLTLASGDVRRVTYEDGAEQLDGWSRDGRSLYFFSSARDLSGGTNDVYRVAADGGTPMPISGDRYANEFFSAVSPDGRTLAMSARGTASGQWWRHGHSHLDEAEIWLRDLTAGDVPSAWRAATSGGAKDLWPMWGSNGTLFFMSDRDGAENIWQLAGTADRAAGTAARKITSFTDGRVLWPSITARGDRIVFERNFRIWSLDTASGRAAEVPITRVGAPAGPAAEHLRLTGQFEDLALSPDGKKIAFAARGEIFAASAKDGGDAARVTTTAAAEQEVAWSPDSRKLVYASERSAANSAGSGPARLVMYDFATQKETPLTSSGAGDYSPRYSPDGRSIAFVRGGTELRVLDLDTRKERSLARGIIADPVSVGHPLAWSPDGKWIAFFNAGTRGFTNVSVVAAAGGDARPVSFLGNSNATGVSWSPDGTFLLFDTNQRTEVSQLARVDLILKTPKFREDQFRDLFNEESPRRATPAPDTVTKPDTAESPSKPPAPNKINTDIVFDGIRQRLSLLPTGLDVGEAFVSPDGKTVVMIAGAAGQRNLYSWSIDETARERPVAKQLTTTAGAKADVCFTPDSKEVYYLDDGKVQAVTLDKRETRAVNLTAELDADFATEKMIVFDQAWRLLHDQFFDPAFNGVDWEAARSAVEPYVAAARTPDEMRRIASLMIGELNASHLGINAPPAAPGAGGVGHLGLDFDRERYEKDGMLCVTHVVPLGPAALSSIPRGACLGHVDGTPIDRAANLDALLENKVNRRVIISFTDTPVSSVMREIAVRPITATTERGLRYREWVAQKRDYVAKASGGRLGYVHMPDMSAGSLAQLYVDLDADNIAHDGVVIDIRNNNGGFVNAYALDVFSRQHYLNMTQRGMPTVPARSSLGQRSLEKPTVLVTNQHSLSDAEDFTEGYRAMKLGKVVGEPTAGWIIYTWNTRLLDGTVLRLPRSRITDRAGAPMEMHPRPVDVEVKRPIGESYGPRDSQLDKAVEVLLAQLGRS